MRTWILLRGLTREAAHWGRFPEMMGKALPRARFLTLDLPGNGVFYEQRSPTMVSGMALACRDELRRQGVAPPYGLLAMSLGAMVATEWARQTPDEIAGCVLINTSFRPFNTVWHRLQPANYGALLRLALIESEPVAMESAVWRLTSNRLPPDPATVAQWATVRAARPVSKLNAVRQLFAAATYRAPVKAPVSNLLLLGSEHDHLVSSACSRAIAEAWNVPLIVHPAAGHDLPLDDPGWVVQQVRRWVDALPPDQ